MYIGIRRDCEQGGFIRRDGQCGLNHYLECNERNCVVLHFYKGTRPPCILDEKIAEQFREEIETKEN